MNKITIDNELIDSIKFYIKLSDNYIEKNQVLKSRFVLIEFLREITYDDS